jgi:adenylate cyclase
MLRRTLICTLSILFIFSINAFSSKVDSLLALLNSQSRDTSYVNTLLLITKHYSRQQPDSGLYYGNAALKISLSLKDSMHIAKSYSGIRRVYSAKSDYRNCLKYDTMAYQIYDALRDSTRMASLATEIAIDHKGLGNYVGLLENLMLAARILESAGLKEHLASAWANISRTYAEIQDTTKEIFYLKKSSEVYAQLNDTTNLSQFYGQSGYGYLLSAQYDSAIFYLTKALEIDLINGDPNNISSDYSTMGRAAWLWKKYSAAYNYYQKSIPYINQLEDIYSQAGFMGELALFYLEMPDSTYRYVGLNPSSKWTICKEVIKEGMEKAKQVEATDVMRDLMYCQWKLQEQKGETALAYQSFKTYISIRDSLLNDDRKKGLIRNEVEHEFLRKDIQREAQVRLQKELSLKELEKEKNVRYTLASGLALLMIFSGVVFRQRNRLKIERDRSEELLLNILPSETAAELRENGKAKARQYDEVTVMFTDFKNFTTVCENMSPEEIVNEIHHCYSAFDKIIGTYGIEKIKTIGDSYMCAAGLPQGTKSDAFSMTNAAIGILTMMNKYNAEKRTANKPVLEIRIGIHTGPVVAGIVGVKKFAYDIWGDTVNIASRIENAGEIGKINISGVTYELVKSKFDCEFRGEISAKNKGMIPMYFLDPNSKI